MSSIALYDIDLFHAPTRHRPNLELMKTYNYYYKNNHKVAMVQPGEDLTRFSKIYYFKENSFNFFPKTKLSDNKAVLYGEGFYNYYESLPSPLNASPPSFLPYDLFYKKIKGVNYEHLKNSSIIRLENQDLTGFQEDKNAIYFVDKDFCSLDFSDFLHEYHNYNFCFYTAPRCHNLKQLEEMYKFKELIKTSISIDFSYNKEIVEKYTNTIGYPLYQIENETETMMIERLIKTILTLKKKEKSFYGNTSYLKKDSLINYIVQWGVKPQLITYYEYYKSNPSAIKLADGAPAQCRLLLKTSPVNGIFDF